MVHVAHICLVKRPTGPQPAQNGKRGVDDGQAERQGGHTDRDHRWSLQSALHADRTEHESEEKRSRIAHEDARRVEIVREKAECAPRQYDRQQRREGRSIITATATMGPQAMATTPAANPSNPSMKLIRLVIARSQRA